MSGLKLEVAVIEMPESKRGPILWSVRRAVWIRLGGERGGQALDVECNM
jgi:hypothetical protein